MFYLSELIGKRIYDNQGNRVARIRDVIATFPPPPEEATEAAPANNKAAGGRETENRAASPEGADSELSLPEREALSIRGLLARTGRRHSEFFIPINEVESLGAEGAHLRSSKVDLRPYDPREGEMLLTRHVWDKQVIDVSSRRVLRVNDVVITAEDERPEEARPNVANGQSASAGEAGWFVWGIDVGISGLLRRLHLAGLVKRGRIKMGKANIIRWGNLDLFGASAGVGSGLHRRLAKLHPVEIARITASVGYREGAEIIASLDNELAADTLEEIEAERQTDIMEQIPDERAADILEVMAPDEATDLLTELSEEKADALLEQMDEEDAAEVRHLMRYPENSAGGIMTTDFVRVLPEMTVQNVIETNRDIFLSADLIYYIYVVESEESERLVGIITVRDLLVHPMDRPVGDFMLKNFLSVRPGENKREVARLMAEYNLLALPVVTREGVLVGVVTVDDALDAILPEGWKKRLPRIFS